MFFLNFNGLGRRRHPAVTGLTTFSQLSVSAIGGGTATVSYAGQTLTFNNLTVGTVLDSADFIV